MVTITRPLLSASAIAVRSESLYAHGFHSADIPREITMSFRLIFHSENANVGLTNGVTDRVTTTQPLRRLISDALSLLYFFKDVRHQLYILCRVLERSQIFFLPVN